MCMYFTVRVAKRAELVGEKTVVLKEIIDQTNSLFSKGKFFNDFSRKFAGNASVSSR
jgi:hypothetical protein